jgi:hypothetical protein
MSTYSTVQVIIEVGSAACKYSGPVFIYDWSHEDYGDRETLLLTQVDGKLTDSSVAILSNLARAFAHTRRHITWSVLLESWLEEITFF